MQKLLFLVIISIFSIGFCGCSPSALNSGNNSDCGFAADDVKIIGLTSLEQNPDNTTSTISVYLTLLDSFDSSFKFPGIFRFELYEFVPRSSQPKGKRITIWDDYDLNNAAENNKYWNDFLRAYHFELELSLKSFEKKGYVLQVTCLTAEGRRLTDIYELGF